MVSWGVRRHCTLRLGLRGRCRPRGRGGSAVAAVDVVLGFGQARFGQRGRVAPAPACAGAEVAALRASLGARFHGPPAELASCAARTALEQAAGSQTNVRASRAGHESCAPRRHQRPRAGRCRGDALGGSTRAGELGEGSRRDRQAAAPRFEGLPKFARPPIVRRVGPPEAEPGWCALGTRRSAEARTLARLPPPCPNETSEASCDLGPWPSPASTERIAPARACAGALVAPRRAVPGAAREARTLV